MRVLIIEPRKCPHVAEIDDSLKSMQEIVGGYIEVICPFEDKVAIVCDEDGKLKPDTEWNRLIPECNDVIKGTFFICGVGWRGIHRPIAGADRKVCELLPELFHSHPN